MLNITHKTKKDGSRVYAEIGSVSAMPKGFTCPDAINQPFVFTYENFDLNKFNSLPDFMKNKMVNSDEYKLSTTGGQEIESPNTKEEEHDDLPF